MCSDNCAEDIISYVNGQLRQLHEKAKTKSSESTDVKYFAEFSDSTRHSRPDTDPAFSATFGCPCIKLVCDHEVVLFLHISGARLYYSKATQNQEPTEMIESCELAFRIPLMRKSENSRASDVDSTGYNKTKLVLNMGSAVFLPEHSDFTKFTSNSDQSDSDMKDRKVADLTRCLQTDYLPMLKRAFEHEKLFWPLDSNDRRKQLDYSLIHPYTLTTDMLFNVSVEDINTFLLGQRLQMAAPSSEGDGNNLHMSLSFGSLHIQRLCECEIVLYFDIQGILGASGEPQQRTNLEWKIAFAVVVLYEEVDEGSTKIIKADQNTAARFCEHLSNFGEHQDKKLLEPLVNQVKTKYCDIFEGTTYIYCSDPGENPGSPPDDDLDRYDCMCPDEDSCGHTGGIRWGVIRRRVLTETHTGEFDLITALTQRSINAHFEAHWKEVRKIGESELKACLAYFSKVVQPEKDSEIGYTATFHLSAPKVKLVSEDSQTVILYLYISEGSLKISGSEKSLQPGYLAYKIKLKTIDSKEGTGLNKLTGCKQIVLSLESATLDWDQSSVTDMFRGDDSRYRGVLADFIEKSYFPVFMRANHHVLCTMPQSVSGAPGHRHAIFSLSFKIIPFTYESDAQHHRRIMSERNAKLKWDAASERDAVVIMGVTSTRQLPSYPDPDGRNWICSFGKEVPLGMVYLSRKYFLNDVLKKLMKINRATTFVPIFSKDGNNQWGFEQDAQDKQDANDNWHQIAKKDNIDSLEFEWSRDKQLRCSVGGQFCNNDSYTVGCSTHNIFSVLTSRDGKCAIHLQGEVNMHIKHEGKDKHWRFELTAKWSANIIFVSSASGLRVQLHPKRIQPEFNPARVSPDAPEVERKWQADAFEALKAKFPNIIDFSGLIDELKKELEGTWTGAQAQAHEYCVAHPVFNAHGDLLLELTVRDKHVESAPGIGTNRSAPGQNGKTTFSSMNRFGM